jgi:hypothetical protein
MHISVRVTQVEVKIYATYLVNKPSWLHNCIEINKWIIEINFVAAGSVICRGPIGRYQIYIFVSYIFW